MLAASPAPTKGRPSAASTKGGGECTGSRQEEAEDVWVSSGRSWETAKGGGQPKAASFAFALNTGHILLLRRKTCAFESQDICIIETQEMRCVES